MEVLDVLVGEEELSLITLLRVIIGCCSVSFRVYLWDVLSHRVLWLVHILVEEILSTTLGHTTQAAACHLLLPVAALPDFLSTQD
jgi:hypothetical protein